MATRFYFGIAQTAPISLAVDSGWARSATSALTRKLLRKNQLSTLEALTASGNAITTGTDKACAGQFISEPLDAQTISGTVSTVIKSVESTGTSNAFLAYTIRVVSLDGATIRGTLITSINQDTEMPTTVATRISSAQALTSLAIQTGDRLVIEMGANFVAGANATFANLTFGYNATTDYALTTALTTSINPWIEFSQDLFPALPNNYQSITVGDGISTTGRVR